MAARRALADLHAHVEQDILDRSRLAVTEVITNSVKHARLQPSQLIDVRVALLGALLRIEVADDGPAFDPVVTRPDPGAGAAGGWGLWLVDQLTDRWGVDFGRSTCVWLEFDGAPS